MNVVPKSYRFADVLSIINGRNQKKVEAADGQYPIYGSGGIMGWANDYICPENTVVIGRKGSINNPIYVDRKFWNVDTAFGLVSNRNLLLPRYLFYFCVCFDFEKLNTTVTIPSLTKTNLLQIKISLPPLEEQEKIIHRLDKLCHLIELKKEQLKRLDILAKSRFIEMFGDPISNNRNWPVSHLNDLGTISRGVSKNRPRNAPELLGGIYPLIQTGDIANAGTYLTAYTSTYSELGLKQSKMWPSGTLCITIAANIAKTAILTFDACFPDSVVGFLSSNKTNQLFVHYWFSFFQKILEEQAPESAQKNINMQILQNLDVICPPLSLQNEFALFVEELDKSKFSISRQQKMIDSCQRGIILHLTGRL